MQIWIAEVEYYQKLSSHAQIGPQGAEKQLGKVGVRPNMSHSHGTTVLFHYGGSRYVPNYIYTIYLTNCHETTLYIPARIFYLSSQ